MVERNGPSLGGVLCNKPSEPLCCVSVNKIFDSVRDKDCLEDLRVYLCDIAQEVVDRATAIRTLAIDVIDTAIHVELFPGDHPLLLLHHARVLRMRRQNADHQGAGGF